MKNKAASLYDMIRLFDNEKLCEQYIKYLCGTKGQYRHQEILDIRTLLEELCLDEECAGGFIYSYSIPQLNKEFDLLKITETACINIELKSQDIPPEKLKRQLLHNQHFLKMLKKENTIICAFLSSTKELVFLKNNDLFLVPLGALRADIANAGNSVYCDLDDVFKPSNVLVSPLNSPERFLAGDYLLTEHQETIKDAIVNLVEMGSETRFIALKGGPGTGKTLLLYDIARDVSWLERTLIVHSGILCEGHIMLNEQLPNIEIISAKELRKRMIDSVDFVVVDEAHRFYPSTFERVVDWARKNQAICLFSYDPGQYLSNSEKRNRVANRIEELCTENQYKLTNKIRTNKELALFITCLRDLTKYRDEYFFKNVRIIYEPIKEKAVETAKALERQGYTYISYTCSQYKHSLDYQQSEKNTHTVIGQEFEGVCMVLDENWHYEDGKLKGGTHPNPDYIFEQLLYQGLTRVRSKLALVICSQEILKSVLPMVSEK